FGTPVFYTFSQVPSNLAVWLRMNPLGDYIEMMRDVTLHDRLPNAIGYLVVVAVSYAVFLFGYRFFMRYKSVIVDVI
ncbi:MAG TPA: ABC transporter, partial [Methylocystis sp.]|nr:ABC transporter [Methylocystis sp.]